MGKSNKVTDHFDNIAFQYDSYKKKNWYYYKQLKKLLLRIIPPGKTVLEIGCGTGDLLSMLNPQKGVGIDVSPRMIEIAKDKHPNKKLHFQVADIINFKTPVKFDYIFMVDVIEHLIAIDAAIKSIATLMSKDTIFINTMANPKWEWILMLTERLKLKMPEGPHERISFDQIKKTCWKYKLKVIFHDFDTLLPVYFPVITSLINSHFESKWKKYAVNEYFLVKKQSG